jgi:hypothetical protein
MEASWGTGAGISSLAPSLATDPAAREYWARCQRTSASPAAAAAFLRALSEVDVRSALPSITAPTLILHPTRDESIPVEAARECRDLIPGATLVELDSDIHLIWLSDVIDEITSEIEAFIVRAVPAVNLDRTVATVLAVAPRSSGEHADAAFDGIIERCRGRRLPGPGRATFDSPAQAIRCALTALSEAGGRSRRPGLAVHTGECELVAGGVRGPAVDIAEQLAAGATPGELWVSQTVRDLVVGSRVELEPRGRRPFDGVPGEWDVFAVISAG